VAELFHPLRRTVEHVYLTDAGGTPLVHLSRRFTSDKDPDLVATMFTAIQNFMNDSFHSMGIGDVRSIEMENRHHVAFGRGPSVLLYIVYRGRESNHLERRVTQLVQDIELRFAPLLKGWDGDMDRVGRLRDYLMKEWDLHPRQTPIESAVQVSVP